VVAGAGERNKFMNPDEIFSLSQKYSNELAILLRSDFLAFNAENFHKMLPQKGGVYHIAEKTQDLFKTIYFGQSNDLKNRIHRNHLMGSRKNSTLKNKLIKSGKFSTEDEVKVYLHKCCAVQFVVIEDELERLSFEHFAISILRPKYNN
jgi:excinuclease UvrABC nuclease subunit